MIYFGIKIQSILKRMTLLHKKRGSKETSFKKHKIFLFFNDNSFGCVTI